MRWRSAMRNFETVVGFFSVLSFGLDDENLEGDKMKGGREGERKRSVE